MRVHEYPNQLRQTYNISGLNRRIGGYLEKIKMQIRLAISIVIAFLASTAGYSQTNSVIYEGARLIIGDATAPIESGAFVVRNGRIVAIGRKGSIKAPAGAARIDLTGKTVMPTLNNAHIHIGYEGYVSWSVENHTPENVLDHLERESFYGVGTAMAMGDQPVDFAIKFQQDQLTGKFPPAARFFFAAGFAPPGRRSGCAFDPGDHPVARRERSLDAGRGRRGGPETCGKKDQGAEILGG